VNIMSALHGLRAGRSGDGRCRSSAAAPVAAACSGAAGAAGLPHCASHRRVHLPRLHGAAAAAGGAHLTSAPVVIMALQGLLTVCSHPAVRIRPPLGCCILPMMPTSDSTDVSFVSAALRMLHDQLTRACKRFSGPMLIDVGDQACSDQHALGRRARR